MNIHFFLYRTNYGRPLIDSMIITIPLRRKYRLKYNYNISRNNTQRDEKTSPRRV